MCSCPDMVTARAVRRSWAVMMRVRTIVEQAGLDPLTPNDLRLPYSTEQQRLAARRQEEGFWALSYG